MNPTPVIDAPPATPPARPLPIRSLPLPGGRSLRWHPRATLVAGLLLLALLGTAAWTLTAGDYPLPVRDVLDILGGGGRRADRYIVMEVRLPRLLTALLVGAALGLAGRSSRPWPATRWAAPTSSASPSARRPARSSSSC
uniref:iron chelate uptake ABC transporter family permease subunit n=1 Tax=Kitasatospora fiedleri TaxID=2991545 RepID=UPI002989BFCE|nr:iron chelate uptake ABC transporter family permease subunit [Kitasatospora fiedleri]